MLKAIFRSPAQSGNIEMLLFIVLALLAILTKSLISLVAIDVGFTFDAAVAIAGLFSFIALFSYIFRPQRTTGKSFGWSRRGASVAEGHFETIDHFQQDIAESARPNALFQRQQSQAFQIDLLFCQPLLDKLTLKFCQACL